MSSETYNLHAESTKPNRKNEPVPLSPLDHTMSDIYQDELYNPSVKQPAALRTQAISLSLNESSHNPAWTSSDAALRSPNIFMLPDDPAETLQQDPSLPQSRSHSSSIRRAQSDQVRDLPATLTSTKLLQAELGQKQNVCTPAFASQETSSTRYFKALPPLLLPRYVSDNLGNHVYLAPNCSASFETSAKLQTHREEDHRNAPSSAASYPMTTERHWIGSLGTLIDGKRYACEACIRGHRVSSCTHTGEPQIYKAHHRVGLRFMNTY